MEQMKINRIRQGTVIDHIGAGKALAVFHLLGLKNDQTTSVTMAIRVPSRRMRIKDILKIENRYLDPTETAMIALIAPQATINIITNYTLEKKERVKLPTHLEGLLRCENPNCITTALREPVQGKFTVIGDSPLRIQCDYCLTIIATEEVERLFLRKI
ncbi:aspartate carbamoyltransferase regulatory subunit [Candidatus Acetothermia bacterium]|jgi:aspartate carbamoyltransferase regulatory subunit|nr:aspartate carbamoyltransferase regulatory subunit [Candidatus Acetothermia bacterium]MCI2426207.1 aspartate carbamoyltransferase regulatory subunit [Candidatus Acetothermia bacterium]MCI2426971.1 aspartate carbamoyltransferase regulatory subunit [Candidatus Acetothermia bacterium]MCI2428539.1 aspartate carbamoyltransferase regulatory subunit [Candidatus Acetothermia bacterium]